MDWNGGVRRRFATFNKDDETVQRQKAYFIRKRMAKPELSPLHHSYFNDSSSTHDKSIDRLSQDFVLNREDSNRGPRHDSNHPMIESNSRVFENPHRDEKTNWSNGSGDGKWVLCRNPEDMKPSFLKPASRAHRNDSKHDEDERRFMVSRNRLLAQRDWSRLSILKPIAISFPPNRSSEPIGKRRKISRSSKCPPPQTVHHQNFPPKICLPNDTVQIKIGRQPLTNRLQQSTKPNLSPVTSMPPSSLATCLTSHESMLLGENEDIFESQCLRSTFVGCFNGRGERNLSYQTTKHRSSRSLSQNSNTHVDGFERTRSLSSRRKIGNWQQDLVSPNYPECGDPILRWNSVKQRRTNQVPASKPGACRSNLCDTSYNHHSSIKSPSGRIQGHVKPLENPYQTETVNTTPEGSKDSFLVTHEPRCSSMELAEPRTYDQSRIEQQPTLSVTRTHRQSLSLDDQNADSSEHHIRRGSLNNSLFIHQSDQSSQSSDRDQAWRRFLTGSKCGVSLHTSQSTAGRMT